MGLRMRRAGGRGGCRRRTTQPIEATGLAQGSAGVLAARSMTGDELTPSPLAPREGSSPEGPRRRRRLGHAAVFGRVIEPDPTEGRGTPKRSLATTQWSSWRTPTMTPKRGKGAFRFWRQRGRMFILIRDIAGVRGAEDERPTNAASWVSARRPVGPEENGASRDRRGIERTEVAAVEARGVIGQDEYLSHL